MGLAWRRAASGWPCWVSLCRAQLGGRWDEGAELEAALQRALPGTVGKRCCGSLGGQNCPVLMLNARHCCVGVRGVGKAGLWRCVWAPCVAAASAGAVLSPRAFVNGDFQARSPTRTCEAPVSFSPVSQNTFGGRRALSLPRAARGNGSRVLWVFAGPTCQPEGLVPIIS